jgi:hypothetical protein
VPVRGLATGLGSGEVELFVTAATAATLMMKVAGSAM